MTSITKSFETPSTKTHSTKPKISNLDKHEKILNYAWHFLPFPLKFAICWMSSKLLITSGLYHHSAKHFLNIRWTFQQVVLPASEQWAWGSLSLPCFHSCAVHSQWWTDMGIYITCTELSTSCQRSQYMWLWGITSSCANFALPTGNHHHILAIPQPVIMSSPTDSSLPTAGATAAGVKLKGCLLWQNMIISSKKQTTRLSCLPLKTLCYDRN